MDAPAGCAPQSLADVLGALLPLHAIGLRFRLTTPIHPGPIHEPALSALLKHLARESNAGADDTGMPVWVDAPESGRSAYQPGDEYRLRLWSTAAASMQLDTLARRYAALPVGAPIDNARVPFGPHWVFLRAEDAISGKALPVTQSLPAHGANQHAVECAFWRRQTHVRVRLQSPARLLRAKAQRAASSGEQRYVHAETDLSTSLFGERLQDAYAQLVAPLGLGLQRGPSRLVASAADVFWVDWAYRDDARHGHPIGGLLGWIDLDLRHADPAEIDALVLGQRFGIGQRRAFGFGRYRLETVDGAATAPSRRRIRGLAQRAAEADNIRLALAESLRAADCPYRGLDLKPAAIRDGAPLPPALDEDIADLVRALDTHAYQPAMLAGGFVVADHRKLRPLAIPPWRDRVAQRALHQVLYADLEPLMNQGSHGYRRGRSRLGVRDAIQRHWREGYRWYFEADITSFFDRVDHARLETRLRALVGDDPAVELVLGFMAAPLGYRGRSIARPVGLPQGAPLSPLMANLMLEALDARLEGRGLKLLRYADDFIVLCRGPDEAGAAAALAERVLGEHGLQLKPEKTAIGELAQGLDFLGYRFVGDLVFDRPKSPPDPHAAWRIPPDSWLAALIERDPTLRQEVEAEATQRECEGRRQPLATNPAVDAPPRRYTATRVVDASASPLLAAQMTDAPHAAVPLVPECDPTKTPGLAQAAHTNPAVPPADHGPDADGADDDAFEPSPAACDPAVDAAHAIEAQPGDDTGTWLHLTEPPAVLVQDQGRLRVLSAATGTHVYAWPEIDGIVLHGRHRLSGGAVQAALRHAVPVHFVDGKGQYLGRLDAEHGDDDRLELLLAQLRLIDDAPAQLALARPLVAARVHNQRETLRQRARQAPQLAAAVAELARLEADIESADDLARLNGHEGNAARVYFAAFGSLIDASWGFTARRRRPPPDPVNALLSLGYTVLYSQATVVVQTLGLAPRLGFYHARRGRHAALASDLMEPFRHVVERAALTLINRGQARPEQFTRDADGACRLERDLRRRWLALLAHALHRPVSSTDRVSGTPIDLIRRQGLRLRACLRGTDEPTWVYRAR